MRKVTVPIDMSSEQKTILGVLSKRQLIYIIAGGVVIYAIIPTVWHITNGFSVFFAIIACFISALPVAGVVAILAFLKKAKYHMYFDRYLLTKFNYKNQKGVWRRGSKPKKWMGDYK